VTGFSGMLDARARVTGRLGYTIDLAFPGMLHAKILRSTSAHARILRVDTTRARRVPGVMAVLTGADLAARTDIFPYFGSILRDQPILAIDEVRYVGEPVAAAAAVDIDAALEALELIEVEYEELPAVFDLDSALAEGAPLVHSQANANRSGVTDVLLRQEPGTNICTSFRLRKGDVEAGFAQAEHIFEDTFTSPPVQHVPMETHACIANVANGRVTVTSSAQIPIVVRSGLAAIFGLNQAQVRVIIPTLGGGYGAKGQMKVEPIASVLSLVARRPVKLHLTRSEEFVTITKHGMRIRMKTGLMNDGTIVARKSTCHFNTGAYTDVGPRVIKTGGLGTGGPHHIPNVHVDSYAVFTNLVPAGAFRGFGISQSAWAHETQMDMIADRLGMDPYELRMKNLLVDGQPLMTGEIMEDAHFKELLTTSAEWIEWDPAEPPVRRGSKVRAKGIAVITKNTVTPSTSTAVAKLTDDGSLSVLTSSVEMGQGLHTSMAILAAEQLGIDVHRVNISFVDTDVTPYDQQTSSSRSTHSMGTAIQRAVIEIKRKLIELASDLLEIAAEDLELVEGRVQAKGASGRSLDIGEIVRRTRSGDVLGEATYRTKGGLDPETGLGIASVHWHQGSGAVEVEVDLETGKVALLRYHAGVYSGRTVNAVQAELQQEGNVAFGVGQALFEEMLFDNGQLQNGSLADYMIASMEDMPAELAVHVLENRVANVIHGVGESALPAVMPAIGNAVFRATGVRIVDLPITPEKILAGLRAQSSDGNAASKQEVTAG
jgi:CO/xanthine dehydrogenase Mo-binding subunit